MFIKYLIKFKITVIPSFIALTSALTKFKPAKSLACNRPKTEPAIKALCNPLAPKKNFFFILLKEI